MPRGGEQRGWLAVLVSALVVLLLMTRDDGTLVSIDTVSAAPAAQAACSPRPRVQLNVTNSGTDTLNVVVSVSPTSSGPTNALQAIRFGAARNATIDVAGGPTGSSGTITQSYPAGTTQASFVVHRQGGAMTVPLTVVDVCGDWPTFVGAGVAVGVPTPTATPAPTATPVLGYPNPGTRVYALGLSQPDLAVLEAGTDRIITIVRYTDNQIVSTFRPWPTANLLPHDLIVHPSLRQVFFTYREAAGSTDVIAVLDTALNQVVKRFPLISLSCGTAPLGMILSADGRRLVIPCVSLPLVLDTTTLTQVEALPAVGFIERGIFDSTSRYLYVPTANGVAKIDVILRQVVASVDLGGGGQIVYDADRNRVYSSPGTWALDGTTLNPLPLGTGGRLNPQSPSPSNPVTFLALTSHGTVVVEVFGGCPPPGSCDGRIMAFDTTTGAQTFSTPLSLPLAYPTSIVAQSSWDRVHLTIEGKTSDGQPTIPSIRTVNFGFIAPPPVRTTEPYRRGILGFSTDGSRMFVALDVGIVAYDAGTLDPLGIWSTKDPNNQNLSPVSSDSRAASLRMYIATRGVPTETPPAVGGVYVIHLDSGQPIGFTPMFDLRSVAITP